MICKVFGSNSPKAVFNVSDCFQEGQIINNRRRWQTPPMVLGAGVHKNFCSEIDSDRAAINNKVSDEDLVLDRQIADPKRTSNIATPTIFSVYEPKKTLKLTTDVLDCDYILVNQEKD